MSYLDREFRFALLRVVIAMVVIVLAIAATGVVVVA